MNDVFSSRLAEAMQARKVKAADLAVQLKINPSALSSYLSGRFMPRKERLAEIAQALDVSPEWLLGKADGRWGSRPGRDVIRVPVISMPTASSPYYRDAEVLDCVGISAQANDPSCAYFGVYARDVSMARYEIPFGSVAVLRAASRVPNGSIGLWLLPGRPAAILRRYIEDADGRGYLVASGLDVPPLLYEPQNMQALGVVVGVVSAF